MAVSASVYAFINADNRIIGVALTTKLTAAEANTAPGGYRTMSVAEVTTAGVDKDEDINELVGMAIDASNVVTAYTPSTTSLRTLRRTRLYGLIVDAMDAMPALTAAKEDDPVTDMHRFLRMAYAAASDDANIDDDTKYAAIEDALKGGAYSGGMPNWFDHLVITPALRSHWNTAMTAPATVMLTIQSNGNSQTTTAALPSGWETGTTYEPIRARIALRS